MARRKYRSTRTLREGMKIDQAVLDQKGRTLIARGAILDEYMIEALLDRGIMGVYTTDGQDKEEESLERQDRNQDVDLSELPSNIRETIERERVEDRPNVSLNDDVKNRVAEGISFLYNNVDAENFIDTTNQITLELLDAIDSNQSIAVDVNALKVSDEYTFKHSVDVATMSMLIAKQHGLSKREIRDVGIAGLLHDIGKQKIPKEILNKPGKLTDSEFDVMRKHSLYGYQMLREKRDVSEQILLGVLQHHEKLNGRGYPLGIPKDKVFQYARIISVADIYDALVTTRPYKKAFSPREALEMIMAMTDELDIEVMRSFIETVILYPVNSIVMLSNGEKGRVVANSPQWVLRPKVVGLVTGKLYDLAYDINCASIIIE